MSNNITNLTDNYIGELLIINNGTDEDDFNSFVEANEKDILRGTDDYGLLGDQVYLALIADLNENNEPQTAPYINLVNGTSYTQTNGETAIFCGIKKMLSYFIYAKHLKYNLIYQSGVGSIKWNFEYSEQITRKNVNYQANLMWNKGVDLYNNEVYDYLLFYQSSFTNWNFTKQSKYILRGII